MARAPRWMIAGLAVLCFGACAGEVPCLTQGAERTKDGCDCPDGTHPTEDKASKKSVCVADQISAAASADGGPDKMVEAGPDARGSDRAASRPDSMVDATHGADGDAEVDATADTIVSPGIDPAGDRCATTGQLRCVMPGSGARQNCQDGRWSEAEACAAGEVCDTSAGGGGAATCRVALEVCKGNADKPVCDGAVMQFCGKTGLAERATPCGSEVQCEVGLTRGHCAPCLPGSFDCKDAKLEKCSANGELLEPVQTCSSAALCNKQAGACTASACVAGSKTCKGDTLQTCNATLTGFDEMLCGAGLCDDVGKQCDVCVPNSKTCEGDSVKTCNAQGQGYTTVRCPSEKSLCTGNGTCVQCEQTSDCPAAPECSVAMCNTASGSCATTSKASGAACSAGVCDGRGNCGPAPKCGDGIKNQASEECDDGNAVQEDDCLNNCKAAGCGDGVSHKFGTDVEACDLTVENTSAWTCSDSCAEVTMYTGCGSESDCSAEESCQQGLEICTKACPTGGAFDEASGCPGPQKPGSKLRPMCTRNFVKLCTLVNCGSDGDCPDGSWCARNDDGTATNDPSYYSSVCVNRPR